MGVRRWINEAVSALMTLLAFLPAAVMLQNVMLKDAPPWLGVLYMAPCAVAYPVGRSLHGRRRRAALCAGALCAALLPALGYWRVGFASVDAVAFNIGLVGAAFALFSLPYQMGGDGFGLKRFVMGIVFYLTAFLSIGGRREHYFAALNVCLLIFVVIGLVVFNLSSLRGAAREKDGKLYFPPGMRRNNTLLTGLLILLALVIVNIGAVQRLFRMVGDFFAGLFYAFLAFLDRFRPDEQRVDGGGSSHFVIGGSENGQNPWLEMLVQILLWAVMALMLLAALYAIYRLVRRLIRLLREFFAWLGASYRSKSGAAYVDEMESSLKKGEWRVKLRESFRAAAARMRRPVRFGDLRTGRQKVRYVYRALLKKIRPDRRGMTPGEVGRELVALGAAPETEVLAFIGVYNDVRYNGGVPGEDAIALAEALYRRVKT
ncbi:DUF4129 domain-containing protein [Oscillospiraceae bacterium OttesenSCG-928-F05]|nr:DUF4129 domain-containing protein [Oscillospiraceae bacterium OttesenSCG-928-F05]